MFNKKKPEEKKEDEALKQVNQDLIVHNMPRGGTNSTGFSGSKNESNNSANSNDKASNFKVVGALIIGLGVVLVGVLIFFSYRYIINPQERVRTVAENQADQGDIDSENGEENSEAKEGQATSTPDQEEPLEVDVSDDINTSTSTEETDLESDNNESDFILIKDTDSDGLGDEEEKVLLTDINNIDTDGDGYLDLEEIKNGYNPAGEGILEDNEALIRYYSPVGSYSVIYPEAWGLSLANNDYTIIISASNNSIMQISVQDNNKMQDILTWYKETFPQSDISQERVIQSDTWQGIMGEDGKNFYLTDEERLNIYVISYIPVINNRLVYPNIFQILINSFEIE